MAAPYSDELNAEASFKHAPLQKTPTQRRPRQKKSYGGLQADPSSSPIARKQSGLTPPKTTRKRTVSAGSTRAGLTNPECNHSLQPVQDTTNNYGTSSPSAGPLTPVRPTPMSRRRPYTDPETPRAQITTSGHPTPPRSVSAPLPSKSEVQTCDKVAQLLKDGPDKSSDEGSYNYLVILKKSGTDEPEMLKIGVTNNVNRRMTEIKSACKYNKTQELPGSIAYTGRLAEMAESLMLAELDALKCLVNCCPNKTHKHKDRFKMADMEIVTEVFHRWLDFCSLAPWDDKGKLKPHWLARLDDHMRHFDTREPEDHQNRLRLHWNAFTTVSPWEKMAHDFRTVCRAKNLLSWHAVALVEAVIICYLTSRSSFVLLWICGWSFIVCLFPLGKPLNSNELWTISSFTHNSNRPSSLGYGDADGKRSEADGISAEREASISGGLISREGETIEIPGDFVRGNFSSTGDHTEDGATSYDEITLESIINDNGNDGDTDISITNHNDADEMDIDQDDQHDGHHSDIDIQEVSSTVPRSMGEETPKEGDGTRDSPFTILDSEDEMLPELPEASVTYRLPPVSSIPAYRVEISSTDLVEQAA